MMQNKKPRKTPQKTFLPQEYIGSIRQVLGKIDISFSLGVVTGIPAEHELTYKDAMQEEWHGAALMVLPPHYPGLEAVCQKWRSERLTGHIREGITFTENATDAIWFKDLAAVAAAIVFPQKIHVERYAITYVGLYPGTFLDVFRQYGWGVAML